VGNYFYFDSYLFPEPQKFDVVPFEIGENKRLASGRMVTDIVCIKKKFVMTYPFLNWLYLKNANTLFLASDYFTLTYPHGGVSNNTATVKLMDISGDLQYIEAAGDDWMYRDITLTLEEQ